MSATVSETKKEFWWRIEVLAWVPFFVSVILHFVLYLNYGSESIFLV